MKKMIVLTRSAGSQVRNIGKYYKILYTICHIVHYSLKNCTYCTLFEHIVQFFIHIAQIRTITCTILYNTVQIFCTTPCKNRQIVSKYVQKPCNFETLSTILQFCVQYVYIVHRIVILCLGFQNYIQLSTIGNKYCFILSKSYRITLCCTVFRAIL